MLIPQNAAFIIDKLQSAGYDAYVVGGCVRDSLLGIRPKDWDICTDALPDDVKSVFVGERVLETGLQHGTLTVMMSSEAYEVTTYREDGQYSDGRHPDEVKFVRSLEKDLARRDFTCNAIAYNDKNDIIDPFDGAKDIEAKLLRCVGDPDERFKEDALRILRALRFAARYGFKIHKNTAEAMSRNRKLLNRISKERIADEINKMLVGDSLLELLSEHKDILFEIIPELKAADGFEQRNKYHCYDILTHTLVSVEKSKKERAVRLTMLFHDIGKPSCFTMSDDGVGHFYGHADVSEKISESVLRRLKYDTDTIKAVTMLVKYHDVEFTYSMKSVRRYLNILGEELLRQLVEVKRADWLAQSEIGQSRMDVLDAVVQHIDTVIEQQQCFSLKDLAINGRDLINAGLYTEGKEIGRVLNHLLNKVIDGEIENDSKTLMVCANHFEA